MTNSMIQTSESKLGSNRNTSFELLSDESTACDEMMLELEKDETPHVIMIDLVGDYLDEMVESNDGCKV